MPLRPKRHAARLRLRTILLIVNLAVLILPLAGAFFFRFYENELVHETEQELIAQSAIVASIYKHALSPLLPDAAQYGLALPDYQAPAADNPYTPVSPQLDLTEPVLPRRPAGVQGAQTAGPEFQAGKALEGILLDAQKTTLSGIRILNGQGVVVSGPRETGLSFAGLPEIRNALAGHYDSVIRQRVSDHPPPPLASISRGTGIRVFVAYPVIENGRLWGVVYASRTPKNILEYLYNVRSKVMLAGGVILALALLLVSLTSWAISKPIYALIDRTKRFTAGDKDAMAPLRRPVTRELEQLSESFSDMAHALQARSDYMRTFAMHVSHEFKTPLTSIRGAVELLQDHDDMAPERKAHFLSLVIEDADRLSRLVSRLLDLARADSIVPAGEAVDLMLILSRLRERFGALDLKILGEGAAVRKVAISAENLEIVLTNLVENSRQQGASSVSIAVRPANGECTLDVLDDGRGISPSNRSRIFTPFFTTRREEGGTGLGLDIVRSILEKHGGAIALGDAPAGALFRLTLPYAE